MSRGAAGGNSVYDSLAWTRCSGASRPSTSDARTAHRLDALTTDVGDGVAILLG